ncbi:MAG: glucosaminidase domain-containing protein [Eggerthellaceae bacterium]|jgi:flagellum-specific peptidoglycan hydrolase FlgJ
MYKTRIIPVLAVSGAIALGGAALPATALAAEASLAPAQAVVQKINYDTYKQMLIDDGCSDSEVEAYLMQYRAAEQQATEDAKAAKEQKAAAKDASKTTGTSAGTKSSSTKTAAAKSSKGTSSSSASKASAKAAKKNAKKIATTAQKAAAKAKKAQKKADTAAKKKAERETQKAVAAAKAEKAAEAAANAKVRKAKHAKKTASSSASTAAPSTTASPQATSAVTYKRVHYSQNLTTEMFIASIGEQARQIGRKYDIYASVLIAQAILESGSGSSTLSKAPYNNLFGIKGAYNGKSIRMATSEDNGFGTLYTTSANFRVYATQKQSMKDYAKLLRGSSFYSGAWKENTDSYKDAAEALEGRYATDTGYAEKIKALIKTYDLTRYDKKLNFKITGKTTTKSGKTRNLTMNDYANLEALATSCLGTDYVWGGNTRSGFDCSGLVQYLYKNALGIQLTRTTYTQQYEGKSVDFDDLQMGDLLFFKRGNDTYHVAMYLGDGFYIHAPNVGETVKIGDMESYTPSFAKRIITTKSAKKASAGSTNSVSSAN